MLKKIIPLSVLVLTSVSFAADKGIHVTFDIDSDMGERAAQGTTEYYFQNGDLRAEVNMKHSTIDNVVMIQNSGKLYTLFPKDKTYMEVPQFLTDAAANLTKEKETATFKQTKQKKKIAGYDCTVYKKETVTSVDTVCVNQPLYAKYKDLFTSMNKVMANQNAFASVEGFPLEASSVGKGKDKSKTSILVKKIDEQNFVGKFDLPKDYTQKNALTGAAELLQKMQSGEPATKSKAK